MPDTVTETELMSTILIIDDDIHIGNMLEEALSGEGYAVTRAYSGTEALLLLEKEQPNLVLLDRMLPGLSGEEVLPQIKGIPVIVVSAKGDVEDKVELLVSGAVDYVTKPFHMKELLARIAIHLREDAGTGEKDVLKFRELTLDTEARRLTAGGGEVKLTRTEFAILKLLMANPNQVITKSRLLDRIAEDTPDCTENSLKTHISHLRSKMRDVAGEDYIESVWGIGFKMRAE